MGPEVTTLREFIQKQEQLLTDLERLISPLDGVENRDKSGVEAHEASGEGNYTP